MNKKHFENRDKLINIIFDYISKNNIHYKYYFTCGDLYLYSYKDVLNIVKHLYKYHRKYYFCLSFAGGKNKKYNFNSAIYTRCYSCLEPKKYYLMIR